MSDISVLSVPGYTSAGPDHWLTIWERHADPRIVRVEQDDWTECDPLKWVKTLDSAIADCPKRPFLVAHSMGCLTVAKWAAGKENAIAGAMFVAPPDVDAATTWEALKPFRPVPLQALDFPAIVVASGNDPHCSIHRAKQFADAWGADFMDIGNAGHIATADGFGEWAEGLKLLRQRLGQL